MVAETLPFICLLVAISFVNLFFIPYMIIKSAIINGETLDKVTLQLMEYFTSDENKYNPLIFGGLSLLGLVVIFPFSNLVGIFFSLGLILTFGYQLFKNDKILI